MPVYEYLCQDCGRRFSRFFWRFSQAEQTHCRCGSYQLEQLVALVSMGRSKENRLESLADPAKWGEMNEKDPQSMARMMKKLGGEMGEDLGPEFNEVVDRLEAGEDPESIEGALDSGDSGSSPDHDNLF